MATFELKQSDIFFLKKDDKPIEIVKKDAFDKFSEDILGLGKTDSKSIQRNAIIVLFDLEGFTTSANKLILNLLYQSFSVNS